MAVEGGAIYLLLQQKNKRLLCTKITQTWNPSNALFSLITNNNYVSDFQACTQTMNTF